VTLPAGGQVDVPLRLRLDPAALGQWWPRHVQACESSPVTLGIAVQPLGFLDVQAQDVPAGTFTTHLACEPPGPPA
jgi:LEA14-like dessication related protein